MAKVLPLLKSALGHFGWEVRRRTDLSRGSWSSANVASYPEKALDGDQSGRFREILSDPLNLLIERDPMAGIVYGGTVKLHTGIVVPLTGNGSYYDRFSDILIYNRGVHEPLEEFAFQELLKTIGASPTMLELGAYWGHYSMWLKKMRPDATVYLVEPDPLNLAAGIENFKRNGLDGNFINEMVGDASFQVDQFMRQKNLSQLDILHADIQGYEVEMLHGCSRSLAEGKISYCFISTHSQRLHEEVRDLIQSAGFRIEADADFEHETTSTDGVIFAVRKDMPVVLRDFRYLGRNKLSAVSTKEVLDVLAKYYAATSAVLPS